MMMVNIRTLKSLAGVEGTIPAGTTYKTTAEEAARMISAGIAEYISEAYERGTDQNAENRVTRNAQNNNRTGKRTTKRK